VVFEATFSTTRSRENVIDLAKKFKKRVVWVEVTTDKVMSASSNIDGIWVNRRIEKPVEIKQRIVVENPYRTGNLEEKVKSLIDGIITSRV
jgi:hypothetical protein